MIPHPAELLAARSASVRDKLSQYFHNVQDVLEPSRDLPNVQDVFKPSHDLPNVQDVLLELFRDLPNVQDVLETSRDLPNVQDIILEPFRDLPNVQDVLEPSCDLPNVQDILKLYHSLPSMQEKFYQPGYHALVMFSQNFNACRISTCVQSHQILLTDLVRFSQYPVMQFLYILSPHISHCWLLLTDHLLPLLCLLVHNLSNVYPVFEYTYVSPEDQHHAAIPSLVRIEMMRSFHRSHDFVALQWRTGKRFSWLYVHRSMLYNLSRSRISYL